MKYLYGLFTFTLTVLIAGCASPAGEYDGSLQSYDNVTVAPGEKLLNPPQYGHFEKIDESNKFRDEIDEYDKSLKSYERYVERAHKAIVTEEETLGMVEEQQSDIAKPNCDDRYFTMPKLPPYPQPPTTANDMSTDEIAILMADYSDELNHYISKAESKVRDSINAYNSKCKISR